MFRLEENQRRIEEVLVQKRKLCKEDIYAVCVLEKLIKAALEIEESIYIY